MTTRRPSASWSSRTFRLHASPHPAFDRMRFLFTMSDIGGRMTDDRGQIILFDPHRVSLHASGRAKARPEAKLMLHRTVPGPGPICPPSSGLRHPNGGARRDRTDDLMLAKHALSQLSYGPVRRRRTEVRGRISVLRRPISVVRMVGLGGLEPPTSRLSSARSNQLSYKPVSEDRGRRTDDRKGAFRPPSSVFRRPIRKRDEGGAIPQMRLMT